MLASLALVLSFSAEIVANPSGKESPLTALPYTPSLDLHSMDRSKDPCVDFYSYACGGWMKRNPIPRDQASWSVYGKLQDENLRFLWGLLEEAAKPRPDRTPVEAQIGDYFAACMDQKAVERAGLKPVQAGLDAINRISSRDDLAAVLAKQHPSLASNGMLFAFSADQDLGDSERVIAFTFAGGLGLPDRDYYVTTDAKSVETRAKYLGHITEMLGLLGEKPPVAKANADKIMALETTLAQASLTRVDKRDPHKIHHKMSRAELQALTPSFKWDAYLEEWPSVGASAINVTEPEFLKQVEVSLQSIDLETWKEYLRWQLINAKAEYLSSRFEVADFNFYAKYLRGVPALRPRWKRCVEWVDRDLGEALGRVFVEKTFGADVKARTLAMTLDVEKAMESEINALPWMEAATKKVALEKLHKMVNKIGYPDRWRDYSSVAIDRGDFAGNAMRAAEFEFHRVLKKIGQPLDRGEWLMTPPTVNAYYNAQMNDMNFPAGVLQPPLFDFKMDDAPNYGNTGATIGHELTHGFDDEGRQFDPAGNLRDWWSEKDAGEFEKRTKCIVDQYAQYTVIDDIKINSKLTLGEDVADLGGTLIAYLAWRNATQSKRLVPIDGFTPDRRFFIGMAQWACANDRPEQRRANAITNPHSPNEYRVNGVVSNMPEFAAAFGCKAGQPMVRDVTCRVW